MKKFKVLSLPIALSIGALILAFNISSIKNVFIRKPAVTEVHTSYAVEVKNPKWAITISDLIIEGNVIKKGVPTNGVSPVNNTDVVYTDYDIQVTKLVKNKSGKDIKIGDTITVRTLGGATNTHIYNTDTLNMLTKGNKTLLCLVDGVKEPTLPKETNEQIYSIVGGMHGAFDLNSNGNATRVKTNESFKTDNIENLAN